MAQLDLDRARDCIAKALLTMEGFEVPLADWQVHATAVELYQASDNSESAKHHRELSCATILKLADSLPAEEPLRKIFLSEPSVRKVLGTLRLPMMHAQCTLNRNSLCSVRKSSM